MKKLGIGLSIDGQHKYLYIYHFGFFIEEHLKLNEKSCIPDCNLAIDCKKCSYYYRYNAGTYSDNLLYEDGE